MKIHKIILITLIIIFFTFQTSFVFSQDSRLPKETTNWLQNAAPTGNGDTDRVNVIFFEVPDNVTSTLYFAVNDPGCDTTAPDVFGGAGDFTDFYLVGGAGCISDANSKLIDYSADTTVAWTTGTLLDNFTADESNAYNIDGVETSEWIYFSGVSPSQGEHIGNKYYFKVVAVVSNTDLANAYQLDISTNNSTTTPTSIPGVRTFSYNWCVMFDDLNLWDIYPFVPDGAINNIVYHNYDFDGGEAGAAYNKSNVFLSNITISGGAAEQTDSFVIGSETSGTWRLRITENAVGPNPNAGEIWFTNSVSGEFYRTYSSSYIPPSPNSVTLTYEDGIAVANNSDTERIFLQIVGSSSNPVPYSRNIYVTVDNSGNIAAINNGTNNGTNALITTDVYGLGWLDVRKPAPTGNVNVRAYWDGTGSSDSFGSAGNTVITINFQTNPPPTMSSYTNKNFNLGPGPDPDDVPKITITNSAGSTNITAGNDIRIRIPAGLNCVFNPAANTPSLVEGAGAGVVNGTVTFAGGNTIAIIDVTTSFDVNQTLTIGVNDESNNLGLQTFGAASSGSLELSYDGGATYNVIDDKTYYIGNYNTFTILTRETVDNDGDGYIERILVTFSEDIDDSTVNAADFLINGSAAAGTDTGGGIDDDEYYILFTDGVYTTDQEPSVQYIGTGLQDSTNTKNLGTESTSTYSIDKAGPAIISAVADGSGGSIATQDAGDIVTITFSENTNQPSITSANIDSLLDLGGNSWLDVGGAIGSATWTDAQTLVITLSDAGGAPTVSIGDTITLDGSSITDGLIASTTVAFSAISGTFAGPPSPTPQITDTRAVVNSDQMYVEFNTAVQDSGGGALTNANFSYLNNYDAAVITVTNCTEITGSGQTEYILTVSQTLSDEHIVADDIQTANIENTDSTAMTTVTYDVSSIGINFFSSVIAEDVAHSGKDWQIETFDGSDNIAPQGIKIKANVDINTGGYSGATPILVYKIFDNSANATFWTPQTGDLLITGSNVSGSKWQFSIPQDTDSMGNGKVLSFVFGVNGGSGNFYCYRAPKSPGSSGFSPEDAETYIIQFRSIALQNNNTTILNNVINPNKGEVTKLLYTLQKSGPVSIAVYDLKSDLVRVLKGTNQTKGNHTVTWDGKNENGKIVTRGVYFIRIRAPGIFNQIRKVLVIK